MTVAYAPNQGLSIFTDGGVHILSIADENLWSYYQDAGKMIVRLVGGDLLIANADGQCQQIQLPSGIKDQEFTGFSYENDSLTIFDWDHDYTYNTDTGVLAEIEHEQDDPGSCSVKYDEQKGHQLLGPDGKRLISLRQI